jgi:hypothetical protein
MVFSVSEKIRDIDIAHILYDWAMAVPLKPGDRFFCYPKGPPGTKTDLSYSNVRVAMKACVVRLGLDPIHYSTHSLRIGGACALRAAGAPDSMIMFMGRWKTLPS